jgi:hypothetical protein
MKHRVSEFDRLERIEHPTLETYERVLNSGVLVDCGPDDHRSAIWSAISVGESEVLDVEVDVPDRRPADRNMTSRREAASRHK